MRATGERLELSGGGWHRGSPLLCSVVDGDVNGWSSVQEDALVCIWLVCVFLGKIIDEASMRRDAFSGTHHSVDVAEFHCLRTHFHFIKPTSTATTSLYTHFVQC
jgi:hypothetical protein